MKKTLHLQKRQSQRSIPNSILDLVYIFGESISENEIYFSKKSALKAKSELEIQHLHTQSDSAFDSKYEIDTIFFDLINTKRSNINIKNKYINRNINARIGSIDKYVGLKLIIAGEVAITCYRCGQKQIKKTSRLNKERFVH